MRAIYDRIPGAANDSDNINMYDISHHHKKCFLMFLRDKGLPVMGVNEITVGDVRRHNTDPLKPTRCGSAYCRKEHEWHESGKFLKAANCGAKPFQRTEVELRQSDMDMFARLEKFEKTGKFI